MRPRLLGFVSWSMATCVVSGLLFWKPGMPMMQRILFWLTPIVSALVIWRFGCGSNWARRLVLVTSFMIVIPVGMLVGFGWVKEPPYGSSIPAWRAVYVAEAILGAFLVIWLNTRHVREFFGAHRSDREDGLTAPPTFQPNP